MSSSTLKKKRGRPRAARASERSAYRQRQRDQDLEFKNTERRAAQDIEGELEQFASRADEQRRAKALTSFRVFCETYFPKVFYLPWSDDHIRIMGKLEFVAREGGRFAYGMPRGSGKSALLRTAALWALLAKLRQYVCIIGSASHLARSRLQGIKTAILGNDELHADFWRELGAFVCLGNNAHKQKGQKYQGSLTHVQWEAETIVFPTIPESVASGSIITVAGLDSNIRGQHHTRIDGTIVRPDLVLLDDPQTRESAYSAEQTRRRIEIIAGDVLGLAGPGEDIAAFVAVTKIVEGDLACQVLDRETLPDWQGECTRMLVSFPKDKKHWEQYDELRIDGIEKGIGLKLATAYYVKHRAAMDKGAEAAWPARFNKPGGEVSAIQHAMNLYLRPYSAGGGDAFMAEYQNEPPSESAQEDRLTIEQVLGKVNGRARGTVPTHCVKLTMFVDVHDNVLFWCVCAWEPNYTGYVIDYGTEPDQRIQNFTARSAPRSLQRRAAKLGGKDAAICAGIETCLRDALARSYMRDDGIAMKLDRILIDKNYKPQVVETAVRRCDSNIVRMARGVPITARKRPIAEYTRKPGQQLGRHWMIPSLRGTQRGTLRYVAVDVNYWKTFSHSRLALGIGAPGSLSLYGTARTNHRLFADHIARSESWRLITDNTSGRTVAEWQQYPHKPDNHWFDCLVGCCAAASIEGISEETEKRPQRSTMSTYLIPRRR